MTDIKAQAMELIQDIPDDKLLPVIEMLKGFKLLYVQNIQNEKSAAQRKPAPNAMGIFSKYANTDLIPLGKMDFTSTSDGFNI